MAVLGKGRGCKGGSVKESLTSTGFPKIQTDVSHPEHLRSRLPNNTNKNMH